MELEGVRLSERSPTEQNKYCRILLVKSKNNLQKKRLDLWSPEMGLGVGELMKVVKRHKLQL